MRSQVHILPLLALLLLAACAGPVEAGDGGDGDCTLTPLVFYDPLTQAGAVRDVHDPALIKQGDRHYLVHHFYDAEEGGVPKLQVRSLLWGEHGWPLAGEPYDDTFPTVPGGAAPGVAGRWAHSIDFAPPIAVTLLEDGRLEWCNGEGTWSLSDGFLTLHWAAADASGGAQTEQVIVARDGAWYVGRRGDGAVVRGRRMTDAALRGAAAYNE